MKEIQSVAKTLLLIALLYTFQCTHTIFFIEKTEQPTNEEQFTGFQLKLHMVGICAFVMWLCMN